MKKVKYPYTQTFFNETNLSAKTLQRTTSIMCANHSSIFSLNFLLIDILQNTVLGKHCCWVLVLQKKWAPVYHRTFAVSPSTSFIAKSRGGGFVLCERAKEKTEWLTSSNSNQRRRGREKSPLSLPPLIVVCTMYDTGAAAVYLF